MTYYKVVTVDLKSLGLRKNPNILNFEIGRWVHENFPKVGKSDDGGIWVANGRGQANTLQKYMLSKGVPTRIFKVEIGEILYSNSYRTKTSKVRLLPAVIPPINLR
jgi:hypothetical protein